METVRIEKLSEEAKKGLQKLAKVYRRIDNEKFCTQCDRYGCLYGHNEQP